MPSATLMHSFPVPLGRRGTAAVVAICVHLLLGSALVAGLVVNLQIPVVILPHPPVHPPVRKDDPIPRTRLGGPEWGVAVPAPPDDPPLILPQVDDPTIGRVAPPAPTPRDDGAGPAATTGPRVLHQEEPPYPAAARRLGEQGVVVVRVLVGIDGNVARAEVATSTGSTRLDNAALASVRHWRFAPATSGSGPVESWTSLRIVFRLTD